MEYEQVFADRSPLDLYDKCKSVIALGIALPKGLHEVAPRLMYAHFNAMKDDMFGIGSTSKMFAAAAAMVLWDQGLVDLDEPITTYIPEFTMQDERYKEIKPRMLMNHSSGLYGSTGPNVQLFDDPDPQTHDNFLSILAGQRLKAAPGEFSVYCNDGFTLLEILVERVSGMSFSQFLAEYFAKPLGLESTKTPLDDFDRGLRIVRSVLGIPVLMALGSGGLYSTAEDLCHFARVESGDQALTFTVQADGRTYIKLSRLITIPGLGQMPRVDLQYQRVEPAPPSKEVLAAWQDRAGKTYKVVSEKATSQVYAFNLTDACLMLNNDFSTGFACGGIEIVDDCRAVNVAVFRDASDLELFTHEGVKYVRSTDGSVFVINDCIPKLTLQTTKVVIGAEGYAQYFSIGTEVEGKTVAVDLPPGAAFAVYDAAGDCVEYSTISENSSAVLPAQGRIVLVGGVGDAFSLQYK